MTISFVNALTVRDAVRTAKQKSLVSLDQNETVENALRILKQNRIQSAPVYQKDETQQEFVAIVSIFDLLGYVCFKKSVTDEVPRLVQDSDALNKTIRQALDDSLMTSELHIFKESDPLMLMIEAFQGQVHRGLVWTESGHEAMVSQIDLVRVLYENVSRWDDQLLKMSVGDVLSREPFASTDNQRVLAVHDQTHAITAFKKMFIHQADGMCVVDSNGGIIADLNASDLEGLADHDLNILEKPVLEFLSIVHDGKIPEVVLCYRSTPLKYLVERMQGASWKE